MSDCPYKDGDKISCIIKEKVVRNGIISIIGSSVYIYQNEIRGSGASNNPTEYKFSWMVSESINTVPWEQTCRRNEVRNIVLLNGSTSDSTDVVKNKEKGLDKFSQEWDKITDQFDKSTRDATKK